LNNNTKKEPTPDKRCGSNAGYIAHSRRGENYCDDCRIAHSQSIKKYDKLNPESLKRRASKYRKANPEKFAAYNLTYQLRLKSYSFDDIVKNYGTNCHICNDPIDFSAPRKVGKEGWQMGFHIDHIVPISKGGVDNLENVRLSHGICNLKKSNNG
jgi:5-methylcytosine-specific restriction endonuclease McrA